MKLTPQKFQKIKNEWNSKQFAHSSENVLSATDLQSVYKEKYDNEYFRFVPCPVCHSNNFFIFHKKTKPLKYAKKKYQNFLITILVHVFGKHISSCILTLIFRRPINISGYTVVKCTNCNLLFRNPIYRQKKLQNVYNQGYLKFLSGEYSQKRIGVYKNILNVLDLKKRTLNFNRRRVLDIGCGFGLFLDLMRSDDWEPYGLDFAEDCIEYAQNVLGLENTQKGDVDETLFEDDFFDLVTLLSVVAHLKNPIKMFKIIHKILRPGGFLIIYTVNANSLMHQYHKEKWTGFSKNHIIFFDSTTICAALKIAGFVKTETISDNRVIDLFSKIGVIPKKHIKYFSNTNQKEILGDMLIVIATNGEH